MATLLGRGNCIEEFPSLNPTIITSCLFYVLHKKFNSSAELTKSHLFCLPPVDILRLQVVVFIFISYLRAIYEKPPRCGEQLLLLPLPFIMILLLTGSHVYVLKTRECEPCKNLPLPSNHFVVVTT